MYGPEISFLESNLKTQCETIRSQISPGDGSPARKFSNGLARLALMRLEASTEPNNYARSGGLTEFKNVLTGPQSLVPEGAKHFMANYLEEQYEANVGRQDVDRNARVNATMADKLMKAVASGYEEVIVACLVMWMDFSKDPMVKIGAEKALEAMGGRPFPEENNKKL